MTERVVLSVKRSKLSSPASAEKAEKETVSLPWEGSRRVTLKGKYW